MEYRRMGRSGLEVSAIGLGTNNFGQTMDAKQAEAVVRRCADLGINMIDTANRYGGGLSEEYIGKAINGIRDKVLLATKFSNPMGDEGPNESGTSRKHILDQVDKSLARLKTDYIDLYQIHGPHPETPIEETLRTLDDLVRQGKVRYIGSSNFPAWQIAQAMEVSSAMHLEHFISEQPQYNMLDRRTENEVVPCCLAYGVGILPYQPLANGFLTGKYLRGETPPEGTRLADRTERAEPLLNDANFDTLDALRAFAEERGHTVLELAFAWLLANPVIGSVIAGATKPEQVEANAKCADWHLSPEEMKGVDEILTRAAAAGAFSP